MKAEASIAAHIINKRGGKRPNAGRKKGEATATISVRGNAELIGAFKAKHPKHGAKLLQFIKRDLKVKN